MIELEVTDAPAEADVRAILAGILAINDRHLGRFDRRPLAVIARQDGKLMGGISGETGRGFLQVELLWVAPDRRGRGLGSRLLRAAEEEARRRGCRAACLETYDFQARPFYERHGYRVFGELDGYPNGHRNFCLVKRLEDAGGDRPAPPA